MTRIFALFGGSLLMASAVNAASPNTVTIRDCTQIGWWKSGTKAKGVTEAKNYAAKFYEVESHKIIFWTSCSDKAPGALTLVIKKVDVAHLRLGKVDTDLAVNYDLSALAGKNKEYSAKELGMFIERILVWRTELLPQITASQ